MSLLLNEGVPGYCCPAADGLKSPDDSQVEKSFTNVYSDARLQVSPTPPAEQQ